MSKRFTDTDKWKKPFIRSLTTPYKLLWLYICDDCDHSGIWIVDLEIAQIRIGAECIIKLDDALKIFKEKIIPFDNDEKWFIPSFIEFQYGILNPANKVHLSVINILLKYDLIKYVKVIDKPLASPLQGAKEKEINKDN